MAAFGMGPSHALMTWLGRVRPTGVHPQTAPLSYLCVLGESERVSPIRIFTTSQPRNLLSIARSNSARSRSRLSRSSQNRIAHTCCGFSARFAPTTHPAFRVGRPKRAKTYGEKREHGPNSYDFTPEILDALLSRHKGADYCVQSLRAMEWVNH
jgi:hypothetical protein